MWADTVEDVDEVVDDIDVNTTAAGGDADDWVTFKRTKLAHNSLLRKLIVDIELAELTGDLPKSYGFAKLLEPCLYTFIKQTIITDSNNVANGIYTLIYFIEVLHIFLYSSLVFFSLCNLTA